MLSAKMEENLRKYHWLFFFAIALLLLYPTLQHGYIMLLDWSVEPFVSFSSISLRIDPLGWIVCKIFGSVLTFGVFQRVFLFLLIVFSGMAGFRLAKKTNNIYAQYFAGLSLFFNPFMYARIVEQTMQIAGGSLMFFWFLVYLMEYLEEKSIKKLFISALFASVAVSFSAHCIFFIAVSLVVLIVRDYMKNRNLKFVFVSLFIMSSVVLILNLNWIVYSFKGESTWASNVMSFSQLDWKAFETRKVGGLSIYSTVASLQGYWGERQDRFISIQENPFWTIGFVMIFLLSVVGIVGSWRSNFFTKPFLLLFIISYILAIGVASPIFAPISAFLYENVPFYIGLREPQKWAVILVFMYAFWGAWGIKYALERNFFKKDAFLWGIVGVSLPILFSFSIFKGMHSHLEPHAFPSEWYRAKQKLDSREGKILFFPWHSYMKFDFAGKNIVNPARSFFGNNVIKGNNTEFGKVYSHSMDPQTLAIEKYVNLEGSSEVDTDYGAFISDMEKMEIRTIMLAKEYDWRKYLWLDIMGLDKTLENDKLIIYEIR
jgi:hypothetical protein